MKISLKKKIRGKWKGIFVGLDFMFHLGLLCFGKFLAKCLFLFLFYPKKNHLFHYIPKERWSEARESVRWRCWKWLNEMIKLVRSRWCKDTTVRWSNSKRENGVRSKPSLLLPKKENENYIKVKYNKKEVKRYFRRAVFHVSFELNAFLVNFWLIFFFFFTYRMILFSFTYQKKYWVMWVNQWSKKSENDWVKWLKK